MKVYIMCGLPGSGKSTYVQNNLSNIPSISRDTLREKFGNIKPGQKTVCDYKTEKLINRIIDKRIIEYCANDQDFVLDNINQRKYRKSLIKLIKTICPEAELIGINIKTPIDVCYNRRSDYFTMEVMEKINRTMHFITEDEVDNVIDVY